MNPNSTGNLLPDTPGRARKAWVRSSVIALVVISAVIAGVVLTNREAAQQASAASVPSAHVAFTAVGLDTPDLQISKNQSVVWEVQDNAQHQLVLSSDTSAAPGFGAHMQFGEGQSYSYVFNKPGIYYYYDSLHPTQFSGKVTVTD